MVRLKETCSREKGVGPERLGRKVLCSNEPPKDHFQDSHKEAAEAALGLWC